MSKCLRVILRSEAQVTCTACGRDTIFILRFQEIQNHGTSSNVERIMKHRHHGKKLSIGNIARGLVAHTQVEVCFPQATTRAD